jgi:DNA polymerase-3 subunit delta'
MELSWHSELWESRFHGKPLPQALLLTGLRGSGEVEFALRIAKSRFCRNPSASGDACGICDDCRWFAADSHPDFRRLDLSIQHDESDSDDGPKAGERDKKKPRTQIAVDEVREVIEFLHVAAYRGGARVVLIHPAHAMNPAAANALLKVLEEPPQGALFLLVTAQPTRLPATIRSRCVKLALPKPTPREAAKWLEASGLPDPGLALAQVGGAPTAALELGERYWTVRSALLPLLGGRDPDWCTAASGIVDTDLPHLVHILQTWCWDLMSTRIGGDVRYHPDQTQSIAPAAIRIRAIALADFGRKLAGARRLLGHPLNAKLFAEDLLLSYSNLTQAP